MKKMFSLALALIMALALAVPAMATGGTGTNDDVNGEVTITNAKEGETYTMYKVLDLTYSEVAGNKNYAYTINADFADFFVKDGVAMTDAEAYEYIAGQTDVPAFATDLANYVKAEGVTGIEVPYNKAGATTKDMAYGYYLMIPSLDSDDNTEATGLSALFSLDTVTPEVEIANKSEYPGITKEADDDTVEIGQIVTYTVTGKLPNIAGFDKYEWTLTDKLDAGLTLNNDVTVTVHKDGAYPGEGATDTVSFGGRPVYADNGFTLSYDMVSLMGMMGGWTAGDPIVITYTATVNEDAADATVGNVGMFNEAKLKYSDDPNDIDSYSETPLAEVAVFTSSIIIDKYADVDKDGVKDDGESPLADAQFVLKNEDGKYYKYVEVAAGATDDASTADIDESKNYVTWVEVSATDFAAAVEGDTIGEIVTVKTTDANGYAEFEGLEEGTYNLQEIVAPEGYNMLTQDVEVEVVATRDDDDVITLQADVTTQIANKTGVELPSTGGMGTTIFYIVGGVMVAGAAILLVTKKKLANQE